MALAKKETDDIIKNKSLRAASARRTATKVIIIVLIVALVLTGGTYGVMTFIDANSMRISITNEKEGLSLSKAPTFSSATTYLDISGPAKMDATTYPWFKINDNILGYNGAHHGSDYVAFSFYLKNVSQTNPCKYTMATIVKNSSRDIDAAIRVMIIESQNYQDDTSSENRSIKIYAKQKDDGTAEYVSYDDCVENQTALTLEQLNTSCPGFLNTNVAVPFVGAKKVNGESSYYVNYDKDKILHHEQIIKYTIVVWFEGTDLECVNSVTGGACSIDVKFTLQEYLDPEYYGE